LLIHTASGVAVTMEDCEELASDENFIDKWDAAAAIMLLKCYLLFSEQTTP
jgi:hypothetical protein